MFCLLIFISLTSFTLQLQVDTSYGPVLGSRKAVIDTRQNEEKKVSWTEYVGIPFAAPPVGDLRFRAPQSPQPWTQPRLVDERNLTICPQVSFGSLYPRSDEDCLYLNVYVPDHDTDVLLPIMFWIHGGGFMTGDGTPQSFGPQYWMGHEVIMVTTNYRLGPLGFLTLGNEDVPGNMGQLDQLAALQWVQQNIAEFGGDKDRVTIFGQSAGAFASTSHLYSPLAQGLFKRVIAQSGVAGLSPSFHHHQELNALKYGLDASILLGCLVPESRPECLRGKDVLAIQNLDLAEELISQPSIDSLNPSPYLPENPLDLLQNGNYHTDIDVMLGFNEDDGFLITQFFKVAPSLFDLVKHFWGTLGPFALFQQHYLEISDMEVEIAAEILNHYSENGIENLGPDDLQNMTDMFTDSFFTWANYLFLKYHLQHSTARTYQYRFSYYVSRI